MTMVKWVLISCLLYFISPSYSLSEVIRYEYDDLNRLTRIEQPDGSAIDYDYDDVGNRIRKEVTPRTTCPGDEKGDRDVDGDDLMVLITDLANGCRGACKGDVDNNGMVDEEDVRMFTEYFGRVDCE